MAKESLTRVLKRSIRAGRRAIKLTLPFQGVDLLGWRKSFISDMSDRGLTRHAAAALAGDTAAAKPCVAFRIVTLLQDPAVRYMPATGAP